MERAGVLARRQTIAGGRRLGIANLGLAFEAAFETEVELRRLFLWLPVALGTGIALYFAADREPSLLACGAIAASSAALALITRNHRSAFIGFVAAAAVFLGMTAAAWQTIRVAAPILDRIRIVTVEGYIEEMDVRRDGARFLLRISAADGLDDDRMPYRIRLTTRGEPSFQAGDYVQMKARLLPPSRAAAPNAYDFARDAWYERIGGVGSVLGRIEAAEAPDPPDLSLRARAAIDRIRNALAARVDAIVGGDPGAIAAAMVTGKRDLLSEDAKEMIREAGIFHVITISGVQMTLVAAIFFVGLRFVLALSPVLALRYPIKKWAAGAAILGAIGYDVMTGSRVGTERALVMTCIVLGAVILDRQAVTMRNLAWAAILILLVEPEALLGASFQLSFAAVGALVAVYEARVAKALAEPADLRGIPAGFGGSGGWLGRRRGHGLRGALFATFCATSATASFMAYDFHELNPYVLIGNPLTLAVIEIFAVPGAILGTLLYPLGLDAWVWHYVGLGIAFIIAAARFIGALPGSTIHLPAFAAWSLPFLAIAVSSAMIWRTALMRATAIPLLAVGLAGAVAGPTFDVAIAPSGDAVAVRQADGRLAVIGRRASAFDAEQWLRADADARDAKTVIFKETCDAAGCIGSLPGGGWLSLVLDRSAFAEDCQRAKVIVTPLLAPNGCAAPLIFDRRSLRQTGAVTLKADVNGLLTARTARAAQEDRPWSPAIQQPAIYWADGQPGGRRAEEAPEPQPAVRELQ